MSSNPTTISNEDIARDVGIHLLLFSLVFGMAASVSNLSFQRQSINKSAIITGLFIQFVILPLIGFMVIKFLNLGFESGLVLLILMTSPSGTYSNWCCSLINGDLGLSITMTLISTCVGIVMIPCNVLFYSNFLYDEDPFLFINWLSLYSIIIVVISAAVAGLFCSIKLNSSQFNIFANRMGNMSGLSLVLFTFLIMSYGEDMNPFVVWEQPWQFYVVLTLPTLWSLSLSTIVGTYFELPKPELVAVAIESSCPNGGIAITLVLSMFTMPTVNNVLAIPLYLALVQFILFTTYFVIMWKLGYTNAPKDDKFFKVITKFYGVEEEFDVSASDNHSTDNGGQRRNQKKVIIKVKMNQDVDVQKDSHEVYEDDRVDDHHTRKSWFQFWKSSNDMIKKSRTVDTEAASIDGYDDDRVETRGRRFIFWKKSKIMDADQDAPTITPNFSLSPETFGPSMTTYNSRMGTPSPSATTTTTKSPEEFQYGTVQTKTIITRKKSNGRLSRAVQSLFIQESIGEDSLAEDPDISIAEESDLESGLSVSECGDDLSISEFSSSKPMSRGGKRGQHVSKQQNSTGPRLSHKNGVHVQQTIEDHVIQNSEDFSGTMNQIEETQSSASAPNTDEERPVLHRELSDIHEGRESSTSTFGSTPLVTDASDKNAVEEVIEDEMEEIMLDNNNELKSNSQEKGEDQSGNDKSSGLNMDVVKGQEMEENIDDHSFQSKFSV